MAGGKGKRMLPYTKKCPKPLLTIDEKPILEHILLKAKMEGFNNNDLGQGHHMIWNQNGKVVWEGNFKNDKPINSDDFPYSLFPGWKKDGSVKE